MLNNFEHFYVKPSPRFDPRIVKFTEAERNESSSLTNMVAWGRIPIDRIRSNSVYRVAIPEWYKTRYTRYDENSIIQPPIHAGKRGGKNKVINKAGR